MLTETLKVQRGSDNQAVVHLRDTHSAKACLQNFKRERINFKAWIALDPVKQCRCIGNQSLSFADDKHSFGECDDW